jgi:hypothetical protein
MTSNVAMHYLSVIIALCRAASSMGKGVKYFGLGTDSIDDAPKISAGIRENALNIC